MSVFTIKNELIIDKPTNAMREWCKDNLIIPNPQYAKAEAMGKWTGNISKTLQMYYTVGNQLRLPFGIARKFYKLFKNDVSQINALFAPIRRKTYNSSISLREYQKNAIEAALKARNGILVAPCGSGKSDEENFGFSYAVLDRHIRTNPSERVDGTLDGEKIERKHSETAHKRALPLKIAGKPLD